jgi:hypothetical protein
MSNKISSFAKRVNKMEASCSNYGILGQDLLMQAFFVTKNMPAKAIAGIPAMEPLVARFIVAEAERRDLPLPHWDGKDWVF